MVYSIYTLSNPVNEEIFYVGCSSNVAKRYKHHKYSHIRSCPNNRTPKDCYILQLMQDPICHVIDEIEGDIIDAFERENFWIAIMIELGFPIVNVVNRNYDKADLANVGDFIRCISKIKPIEVKHIAA